MRHGRYPWGSGLALTAVVMAFLLIGGHLSAQPAPEAPTTTFSRIVGAGGNEVTPLLFAGPKGEVFRLWERLGDVREGGGAIFLAMASPQQAWQPLLEVLPQEKGVSAGGPNLAVGPSGELAVTYQWFQNLPRIKQIRLARSGDGGKTWTQSTTPLDSSGKAFTPWPGWGPGRNLVVVWEDERRENRTWDIYARRSPDGGATWGPEQVLSRFSQQSIGDLYARPEMVSDGQGRFWVVWLGLRNGRSRLYLNRSTDGGQTWADPVELSGQSQSVFAHRLVRSGERLVLVWQDARTGHHRIYAVSSADGGVTWTSSTQVDHLPADAATHASAAAVVMSPAGEVFVAWYDGRNGRDDIFVGRSVDGGRTWENQDVRLETDEPGTGVSRFPGIARAADGRIAVAWEDDRGGYEGIYLRVRGTGERPMWGPEVVVAPAGSKQGARGPRLLWGTDGALFVTWEVWDYTGGGNAVTKRIDGRTLVFDKK